MAGGDFHAPFAGATPVVTALRTKAL